MADKKSADNSKKTVKGKPFKKGQSGNPGGRPKLPEEFKELARTNSIIALQKAIDIMTNPNSDPKDVLKAADMIMDRGFGKATQAIEAKVEGNMVVFSGENELTD
jgi:hypothetical protein